MAITHYQESKPVYAPNTFPLLYITVMLVLGYSIFLVGRSVWDGVRQQRLLMQKQAEVQQLQLQVEIAKRFVAYQQTPSYIERQAREHFAFIKPGETVVAVPQNIDQSQELQDEQAGRSALGSERVIAPHLQQWWDYFFGRAT